MYSSVRDCQHYYRGISRVSFKYMFFQNGTPLLFLTFFILTCNNKYYKHSQDQIRVQQRLLRMRTILWIVVIIYNNILSYDGFTSTSISAASSNNTMCDLLRLLLHFFTPPLSFLSEDHHDTIIIIIIYLRQFNNVLT